MSDTGGSGDPTETLDTDWPHSPQASQQHYTASLKWGPEGKGKEDQPMNTWRRDLEADVKDTDTPGENWRDLLRTGVPGGVMLAAYAPEGAMKASTDLI